ncbi:MAG TPA: hypothetical protein VEL03_00340, partial [Streptosporangiaceae bacterium]|nr:hypothetical protein [Streptosporangiaceae bacterium]
MTDLEDRLRSELRELAEQARPGSIRPLRAAAARRQRSVWMRRRVAPLIAAVAVIGLAVGVAVVNRVYYPHLTAQPSKPSYAPPPRDMPRYYVTAFQAYVGPQGVIKTYAVVHDSATGRALVKLSVPTLLVGGGAQGPSITAAADDRTFLITELNQSGDGELTWFFLLKVAADGRSASLTKLPLSVPSSLSMTDDALSPDGTRLAIDVQHCTKNACPYVGIRVVTLATGAVSSWMTHANGASFQVAWAGDSHLSFEWQASSPNPAPGEQTGYRLLSLAGTGGDLMASQAIASPPATPTGSMPLELVTPAGLAITSSVQNFHDGFGHETVVARILEL